MSQTESACAVEARGPLARSRRLMVGLLLLTASLAVAAGPAEAAIPDAPRVIEVVPYKDQIRIYFLPPTETGGSPVTGYKIERTVLINKVVTTATIKSAAVYIDRVAAADVTYIYRIAAVNAEGVGAFTEEYRIQRGTISDLDKFGGDDRNGRSVFVRTQYQDLLGRAPTMSEREKAISGLEDRSVTAASLIDSLVNNPERIAERHPVIRLYFAYFDRAPDHGGMDFWVNARKNGDKSIDDESSSFATSNEFKTTYGSLSDTEFVRLVYNNVLQRDPELSGLDFWLDQLDTNQSTRGRMMTQFSESNEFIEANSARTLVTDVYDDMIGKAISENDLALWELHLESGGTAGTFATQLLRRPEYVVGGS